MLGNGSETLCGNRDRTSLSRFQENFVGVKVLNFGKGAFWNFFLSLLGLPANCCCVMLGHSSENR